jgi:hypothetical protein
LIANRTAADVAEIKIETRIPSTLAKNLVAGQIGDIIYGTAKAGGAD